MLPPLTAKGQSAPIHIEIDFAASHSLKGVTSSQARLDKTNAKA